MLPLLCHTLPPITEYRRAMPLLSATTIEKRFGGKSEAAE